MGESVFSGLALTQLAPYAAAYLFGIATGWLIWGGRRGVSNEDAAAARLESALPSRAFGTDRITLGDQSAVGNRTRTVNPIPSAPSSSESAPEKPAEKPAAPKPPVSELAALEEEIRKANELLDAQEEEAEAFSEELAALDQSVKRANGRLKLVIRAVQRAAGER